MQKTKEKNKTYKNVRLGSWIIYQLHVNGLNQEMVAKRLGCSGVAVTRVIWGHQKSARVQSEIARLTGYDSWDALVHGMGKGEAA